jgi:cytoskeletal protein RodZ
MTDVGSQLRAAREAKGLTLEQAYKLTRIKALYLEALEANQLSALPGLVQARGFLRTYANFLGLDGEGLATTLDAEKVIPPEVTATLAPKPIVSLLPNLITPAPDRSVPAKPIEPPRLPKIALSASRDTSSASPGGIPTNWLIVGAIVLFVLGVLLVISALSSAGTHPAPTSGANIPMSVSASMVAPSNVRSTIGGPVSITVAATEHVWVRITLDGQTAFEGLLRPGASQSWQAADQIIVETGNAAGLTVTYDGRSSVLGNRGQIVARAWGQGGSEDVPLAASTAATSTLQP